MFFLNVFFYRGFHQVREETLKKKKTIGETKLLQVQRLFCFYYFLVIQKKKSYPCKVHKGLVLTRCYSSGSPPITSSLWGANFWGIFLVDLPLYKYLPEWGRNRSNMTYKVYISSCCHLPKSFLEGFLWQSFQHHAAVAMLSFCRSSTYPRP